MVARGFGTVTIRKRPFGRFSIKENQHACDDVHGVRCPAVRNVSDGGRNGLARHAGKVGR